MKNSVCFHFFFSFRFHTNLSECSFNLNMKSDQHMFVYKCKFIFFIIIIFIFTHKRRFNVICNGVPSVVGYQKSIAMGKQKRKEIKYWENESNFLWKHIDSCLNLHACSRYLCWVIKFIHKYKKKKSDINWIIDSSRKHQKYIFFTFLHEQRQIVCMCHKWNIKTIINIPYFTKFRYFIYIFFFLHFDTLCCLLFFLMSIEIFRNY